MIVEERMRTFINSLDTGNTPFLDELECSALSEGVPIIRKEIHSQKRISKKQEEKTRSHS